MFLGNLEARRDWAHARYYVEAVWMMWHAPEPDDYVIATGESHSVREFLDLAAKLCILDWTNVVERGPRYLRPTEVGCLLGDASKAKQRLGWTPRVSFGQLVRLMVGHDLELAHQERTLTRAGHAVGLCEVLHG